MKNIFRTLSLLSIGLSLTLLSCDKEAEKVGEYRDNVENNAYVRIIHAAPNFRQVFSNMDTFNVYYAGNKVNGNFLTYGSNFPGTTGGATYASVPSGFQLGRITVRGVSNPDSVSLHTFTRNLEPGQYYTLLITDSIKTNKENEQMWLKDNFSKPDTGQYSLRFVHAVQNDTAGRTVDLYSVKHQRNLFTAVNKNTATAFTNLQFVNAADTLLVRRTGTMNELARLTGTTFGNQRVYTVIYRGNTLLTTGAKARSLITYTNL